ncbi:hypothetical protein Ciccas_002697 [Cichlidogyrus casuarinus]|uniref:Uncharacterized protein n=1 Tax=Cichlidogyrus casuarinus TaxID=1844966 RepID=A0ABD2QH34_9PLAT
MNRNLQELIGQQKAQVRKKATLRSRIISDQCVRALYMACATVISGSAIVSCILLHLVMIPYLSESVYEPGWCHYDRSQEYSSRQCENKCSKDRSSFPCLRMQATYLPDSEFPQSSKTSFSLSSRTFKQFARKSDKVRRLFIYDSFGTYAAHKVEQCAYGPCHKRADDNTDEIHQFKHRYENIRVFRCYARPYNWTELLAYKVCSTLEAHTSHGQLFTIL